MAALYEAFFKDYVFMEKTHVPDAEGGNYVTWVPGKVVFSAAVVKNSSLQARIAEQEGVTNVFDVVTEKKNLLEFHDVIKRVEDDQIYRITSNSKDIVTPDTATFQLAKATCEEWELTT